jgi:hypothetical protein
VRVRTYRAGFVDPHLLRLGSGQASIRAPLRSAPLRMLSSSANLTPPRCFFVVVRLAGGDLRIDTDSCSCYTVRSRAALIEEKRRQRR